MNYVNSKIEKKMVGFKLLLHMLEMNIFVKKIKTLAVMKSDSHCVNIMAKIIHIDNII